MDRKNYINQYTVFRHEDKYILSHIEAQLLRAKLGFLLQYDLYGGTEGYTVRSLYYDSMNAIDLVTKYAGDEIRKKIRLRIYSSQDETCKLEVKQKIGNQQKKISLIITREEAERLIRCDYKVLTKYFDQSEHAIDIYQVLTLNHYRPAVLIEYNRQAYFYPLFDTRITFDSNIRSSESCIDLFCKDPIYTPQIIEDVVLEVKYNEHLVDFVSEILKPMHLVQCSVSKYCYGRPLYSDFIFS